MVCGPVCASRALSASGLDSDLFFYVVEGQPKCFIEEMPSDVTIIGSYRHDGGVDAKPIEVKIYGPKSNNPLSTVSVKKEGRFAYHSDSAGTYRVCLESAGSWPPADKTAKFHLRVEVSGKDAKLDDSVAKKEHIRDLSDEIRKLDDRLDLLVADIDYSKEQEAHFRDQSEKINSRIMWWSILQTAALLVAGAWQVINLKAFFKKKKLV